MRPYVLTIAGFDPSAGAGVLADIKTFENHHVYGLAVNTCTTYQNEDEFVGLNWIGIDKIKRQIDILFAKYEINFVKVGLVISLPILEEIIGHIKQYNKKCFIIWDPIIKSGSGFEIHKNMEQDKLLTVCEKLSLITPNLPEMEFLFPKLEAMDGAHYLSYYVPALLKGGHSDGDPIDFLYQKGRKIEIYQVDRIENMDKHGTGCVLSAAILANLALGYNLEKSCRAAKKYVTSFIISNTSRLGYHLKDYHLTIAN